MAPTREIILSSSPDGPIIAYNPSSGDTLARFTGSRSPRNGLILLAKKHVAASHVSSDTGAGSIHLYNWWSSTVFYKFPVPEPVAPLAATSDGSYIFAGGISGQIHALSFPSGDVVQSFPAHKKSVSCLEISNDNLLLISGSDDGSIAVIPVYELVATNNNKVSVLQRFVGHEDAITAITCGVGRPNCSIISCSKDCTCKMWSLMQRTPLRSITFPCPVWGLVMDLTESEFYAAGSDGLVYKGALIADRKHKNNNCHKISTFKEKHNGEIMSIGLVDGGRNLVTAAEEGGVWIWDVGMGQVVNVVGEKLGIISTVVVVGLCDEIRCCCPGAVKFVGNGFCGREIERPVPEAMEMEERLNVVLKNRRAISNMESAIGIYEKMLQLILKQAKAEGKSGDDGGGEDDEDKNDV